ncbi:hypothetical protein MG293_011226 [Ovis ammon polii]|uniref:Integrin beta-like protein 1 n=1 Tax=Ovis ammon polii TaxID=230172 RepID=A0AAD4Y8R5_OVIAM|nr:hypothetical protein MG293_011226 [Ovis ammon polii]
MVDPGTGSCVRFQPSAAGHGKCDCGRCKCDEGWFGDACQYPTNCDLTKKKSNQMCKNSQDIICSNAGTCHCGRCKCDNSDGNGLVYGKFCECDDRECIDDETEEICGGMYINFAKKRWICVCGECSCHDVDPTGDWGDIHGDTCECDERDCRAVYDRYSDDFCSETVKELNVPSEEFETHRTPNINLKTL